MFWYKSQGRDGVFNPGGATDAAYDCRKKSGVYDPGGAQDVTYNSSRKAISSPGQPSGKVISSNGLSQRTCSYVSPSWES